MSLSLDELTKVKHKVITACAAPTYALDYIRECYNKWRQYVWKGVSGVRH